MREPKNQFLAGIFHLAARARDEIAYKICKKAGLPLELHTSLFPVEDVGKFLKICPDIASFERIEVQLEKIAALRLRAAPALMPGRWRIGMEIVWQHPHADTTTGASWFSDWFRYDQVRSMLSGLERAGFEAALERSRAETPDKDRQARIPVLWKSRYSDVHPGHVVRAFELEPFGVKPKVAEFHAAAAPKEKSAAPAPSLGEKVVYLLEKRVKMREKRSGKPKGPAGRK